jgi:hypothetical protein
MKLSAILAPLLDAKADHETIRKTIIAYENEQIDALARRRESDARRQAEKRERDKSHVTSRDVTVTVPSREGVARVEDNLLRKEPTGSEEKEISSANSVDREFAETFWPAYPLKRDRGHALKAFRAARQRVPLETIMAGVHRYAAERAGDDPKFTKYAQGWLNGDGWADEPRPKVTPQATAPPAGRRMNPLEAYQQIAKAKGWVDEPGSVPSSNEDAQRLPAEPSGHHGVVVDLRRGPDGHFGSGDNRDRAAVSSQRDSRPEQDVRPVHR